MRLSPEQKQHYIDNIKKVYFGYLALDFSQTKQIVQVNGMKQPVSMTELFQIMKEESQTSMDVRIADKQYTVKMTKKEQQYTLQLSPPVQFQRQADSIHALEAYSADQIANLFVKTPLIMEEFKGETVVSLPLQGQTSFAIGGPGKIGSSETLNLYRTHLVTLTNIIRKLEREHDLTGFLVALATGTGKTFVQALMIQAQLLAGVTGIFGVPDELISQFMRDLKKLLPDNIVAKMFTLRQRNNDARQEQKSELAKQVLNNLNSHPASIVIADSRRLLDEFYIALLEAPKDTTFLSIDEVHLLTAHERRRKRVLELTEYLLSLFLTATPDEELYEVCGSEPVASMSNRQKEAAGQGRLPKFETLEVPFFSDLNKKHTSGWSNTLKWLKNEIFIRVPNWIFPEVSSAAQYAVERMPFMFHYERNAADQQDYGVRWNLHAHAARKVLCVVEDNETLVNLMHYLHENPAATQAHIAGKAPELANYRKGPAFRETAFVYSKGAFEFNGVHDFVKIGIDSLSAAWTALRSGAITRGPNAMPDIDIPAWGTHELIAKERAEAWAKASAQLPDDETKERMKTLVDQGFVAQLKSNMFHYLIEYVLSDMTGLDQIQLDHMRKTDLAGLMRLIEQSKKTKSAYEYTMQLKKLIDDEGAELIGGLLSELNQYLHNSRQNREEEKVFKFVDNWFLDSSIMDEMTDEYGHYRSFSEKFDEYVSRNLMMSVMAGMDGEETPIKDSKPFNKFSSIKQPIFDEHGRFAKNAKKRSRNSFQVLFRQGSDDVFFPEYLDVTEEQAYNYYRLGFVGICISNKIHRGFSDLNTHTVLNLAEQTVNPNNSPECDIQASGRNRGLNPHVIPICIKVMGHHQKSLFDLKMLDKDDYYKDYFKAQAKYNDECVDLLGINLAKRINEIYFKHKGDEAEPIDIDALHADISQEIAKYLREINNRNSHNIVLSRKLLPRVVAKAMSVLENEVSQLRTPYTVPPMAFSFLNMLGSGAQSLLNLKNYSENERIKQRIKQHEASLTNASRGQKDEIFLRIANQPIEQAPEVSLVTWWSVVAPKLTKDCVTELRTKLQPKVKKPQIPSVVLNACDLLVNSAKGYGYNRDLLLTYLNYSTTERDDKLSRLEKIHLLPRLVNFESLLNQHGVTKQDLVAHFAWKPSSNNAPPPPEMSIDAMLQEMPNLYQALSSSEQKNCVESLWATIMEKSMVAILQGMTIEDLKALLEVNGYHDASAGAQRIMQFMEILQTQSKQRFASEFLTSVDPALFKVVKECQICIDSLVDSHRHLNQAKYDRAYLKITQNIDRYDMLSSVLPGFELIAWFRKKLVPVRNAYYRKLIELGVPESELQGVMQEIQNKEAQEAHTETMPPAVQKNIDTILNDWPGPPEYFFGAYLFEKDQSSLLDEKYKKTLKDTERLLKNYSISKTKFMGMLQSGNKVSAKKNPLHSLMAELIPCAALIEGFLDKPNGPQIAIDIAVEHLSPIVFHPLIADTINVVLKHLNKDDLVAILEASGSIPNPSLVADWILAFNTIIQTKDIQKLRDEFLTLSLNSNVSFKESPLAQTIRALVGIALTIDRCQTEYTGANWMGGQYFPDKQQPESAFLLKVSNTLREIHPPFRQKEIVLSMAKGAIKGLRQVAVIAGDANGDDIRFLTRIKNHILRPIWWTSSLSKWSFAFVEAAKNVYFWVRDKAFFIWNKLCELVAWARGRSNLFRPSVKSEVSAAYNAATFDLVRDMNDLRQFTAAQVSANDCPKDSIVALEQKIAQRRTQRMFTPTPPTSTSPVLPERDDHEISFASTENRM